MTNINTFFKKLIFLFDFKIKNFKKWTILAKIDVHFRPKNILITFRNGRFEFLVNIFNFLYKIKLDYKIHLKFFN